MKLIHYIKKSICQCEKRWIIILNILILILSLGIGMLLIAFLVWVWTDTIFMSKSPGGVSTVIPGSFRANFLTAGIMVRVAATIIVGGLVVMGYLALIISMITDELHGPGPDLEEQLDREIKRADKKIELANKKKEGNKHD